MSFSRRQKAVLTLLVIYWLTIFTLTHIPLDKISNWVLRIDISDKTLHYLAYLLLSFLLWVTIVPQSRVNWLRPKVWWILLVIMCYGAIDEWLQNYVGRNCSIMDFFADLAGAFSALIVLSIFAFWPALLIVTAAVIFGLTNLSRVDLAALSPVTNIIFHLTAYALLSIICIRYLHSRLPRDTSEPKRLFLAFIIPTAFLFFVKLISVILGKGFQGHPVFVSIAAIAIIVVIYYAIMLLSRKKLQQKAKRQHQE
ncbi:VanZ family protein [Planctomycetota bacterium]